MFLFTLKAQTIGPWLVSAHLPTPNRAEIRHRQLLRDREQHRRPEQSAQGRERNRRQQSLQARAFYQLAPQSNVLTYDSIVMARDTPEGLDSSSGTAFDR